MGESYGQKQAKKYTGKQVKTLQQGQQQMLQDPLYLAGQQLAHSLMGHEQTFTPELVNQIKANRTGAMYDTYNAEVGAGLERAGAQGAYRDGSTRMFERNRAADLANSIGNMNQQVDIAAAGQRYPDLMNANSLYGSNLNQTYSWNRDIANAYGGAATNPRFGEPTATQSALGGLGGLAGALIPAK
jgi:hypothetical protein